jgi:IclR family acetate operon transcriptional repressor
MIGQMSGATTTIGSVAKAAQILRAFSPSESEFTVRALAARTGIPRSTCHALCSTLLQQRLLDTSPAGRYRLGPALVGLGGQVIARTGLVEATAGYLEELARLTRCEVHVGQLVEGWIVYLARVPRRRNPAMNNLVGLRVPAFQTGCGKAALSRLPDATVRRLVAEVVAESRTTAPDVDQLLEILAEARAAGFVVNREYQRGRVSIAAPLVTPFREHVVGGISVATLDDQLSPNAIPEIAKAVRETAARVSERVRA